jgi:hypothetical protein
MNWNRLAVVGTKVAAVGTVLSLLSCGSATLRNSDAAAGGSSGDNGSRGTGGAAGTSQGGAGGRPTSGTAGTSAGGASATGGSGGAAGRAGSGGAAGTGGNLGTAGTTSNGGEAGAHPTAGMAGNSDGGVDAPSLAVDGTSCSVGNTCKSGFCVDGLCCNQNCNGQCQSCKETATPGQCVIVGGAPRNGRTPCGGTSPCQATCDGTNGTACTFPGNSVQCTAASCSNGSATTATVCNGAGACTTSTKMSCSSNQCADNTKCSGGCSGSLPCGNGNYCDSTGVCLPLKTGGIQCSSGSECSSTFCVDNVCCNVQCNGQCQGCDEGTPGTCVTIKGSPRGNRQPCSGTDATCAGSCDGNSASACAYPGVSMVCGQPGCNGNIAISAALCDGHGDCTTPTTSGCGAGTYCNASAGACANQLATGGSCQADNQCTSGHCCGGTCANLTTDNSNCGACAMICASGKQTCTGGSCLAHDGQPCSSSGQCLSGVCNFYYVDADGDSFGSDAAPMAGFCNVTTTPSGYATRNGDCCDSNSNVLPYNDVGAAQPATPFPCGTMVSPWDYNCDGQVEVTGPDEGPNVVTDYTCGGPPSCTATPVEFPASVCGQQFQSCSCSYDGGACVHSCSYPEVDFWCF